jgi:hypothetical protein
VRFRLEVTGRPPAELDSGSAAAAAFFAACTQVDARMSVRLERLDGPAAGDRRTQLVAFYDPTDLELDSEVEVEDEAAIRCSACIVSHDGKLARPCKTTGCECYCNRSARPPRH